jgi:hypothetical protein
MTNKDDIRNTLKMVYGDFITYLEREYEDTVIENLVTGDIDSKRKWMTYNQVIIELRDNLKDILKVKELQYKLTEKINPNDACLEVLKSIKTKTPELERLYYKIMNFK